VSSESEQVGYPEPGGEQFTAGHSGSDTSRERAVREAGDGTKKRRELQTLALLRSKGTYGMTVKELREEARMHHGQASSVLSTLHKAQRILRLEERRDRCHVYVYPPYSMGRAAKPQGRARMIPVDDLFAAFYAGWVANDDEPLDPDEQNSDKIAARITFDRWMEQR